MGHDGHGKSKLEGSVSPLRKKILHGKKLMIKPVVG
jgi:hypothetical protein